jgi:DNA-binding response OmpR family regulator
LTRTRARPLVLVADDDKDILQLVALRLEREGYEVVQAVNGDEAVRLAKSLAPDIALLDVTMPGRDGYEVTRELRRLDATSGMPVILLTARVQDSDIALGIDSGADAYVAKPFSPQELAERVRLLLEAPRTLVTAGGRTAAPVAAASEEPASARRRPARSHSGARDPRRHPTQWPRHRRREQPPFPSAS